MRHLMYSLRQGVSRLPRVAFHKKRTGIPGALCIKVYPWPARERRVENNRRSQLASGQLEQELVFGFQHVLDDLRGPLLRR